MSRCYPLSYRGEISIDYPAQGNTYNTLPPSERRDLWGVGTVYGRTLIFPPISIPGESGIYIHGDARASIFIQGTFEVRFEPVSSMTSNVKVLPAEPYEVKYRSIIQPRVIL